MANQTSNNSSTGAAAATASTMSGNTNNATTTAAAATSSVNTTTTTTATATPLIGLPTIVIQAAAAQQQQAAAVAQTFLSNASHSALLQNTNAILDVVLCKLNSPFHIINDPRLLDCGHSACLQCIIQLKDSDKNIKCVYCNSVHKIPLDTSKLTVNKNLQTFIKYNFKQNLNQNFLKQFEDSMSSLEEKFQQQQNSSAENLDQYLNIVENDIQIKIENMRVNLEKIGEQFIHNIRTIRKELQKKISTSKDYESKFNIYRQLIENKDSYSDNQYQIMYPFTTTATTTTSASATSNNDNKQQQHLQSQQQQQQHHHPQQQQHLHLQHQHQQQQQQQQQNHHLTHHAAQQQQQQRNSSNTATAAAVVNHLNIPNNVFNANLLSTITNVVTASNLQSNNSKNALLGSNNDNNTNLNSLNAALNGTQTNNFQNFSNSSSFQEDLDDLEELSVKPVNSQSQKRHLNKEQAQFNKFVREEVTKRFGENFLLQHEVNQLESSIMDLIKNEAIQSFLPKNTAPARAWTLAKVSLRSLKRDLRRKQNQCYKKQDCSNQKLVSHSYFDSPLN